MQPIIKHRGIIKTDLSIKFYNEDIWREQIKMLRGNEFELIIKKKGKKPSNDSHAYYRGGILTTCMQHESFAHFDNPDQIHEDVFAPMFLSYTQKVVVGNESWIKTKVRSTADLTQDEMNIFIQKVLAWLTNNEGIVPLSPEDYYSKYYKTVIKK